MTTTRTNTVSAPSIFAATPVSAVRVYAYEPEGQERRHGYMISMAQPGEITEHNPWTEKLDTLIDRPRSDAVAEAAGMLGVRPEDITTLWAAWRADPALAEILRADQQDADRREAAGIDPSGCPTGGDCWSFPSIDSCDACGK